MFGPSKTSAKSFDRYILCVKGVPVVADTQSEAARLVHQNGGALVVPLQAMAEDVLMAVLSSLQGAIKCAAEVSSLLKGDASSVVVLHWGLVTRTRCPIRPGFVWAGDHVQSALALTASTELSSFRPQGEAVIFWTDAINGALRRLERAEMESIENFFDKRDSRPCNVNVRVLPGGVPPDNRKWFRRMKDWLVRPEGVADAVFKLIIIPVITGFLGFAVAGFRDCHIGTGTSRLVAISSAQPAPPAATGSGAVVAVVTSPTNGSCFNASVSMKAPEIGATPHASGRTKSLGRDVSTNRATPNPSPKAASLATNDGSEGAPQSQSSEAAGQADIGKPAHHLELPPPPLPPPANTNLNARRSNTGKSGLPPPPPPPPRNTALGATE